MEAGRSRGEAGERAGKVVVEVNVDWDAHAWRWPRLGQLDSVIRRWKGVK